MNAVSLAAHAIPVRPEGLTITGAGVWTGVFVIIGSIVLALIKLWPIIKKLQNESDASLRADLLKRISDLEANAIAERAECQRKLDAMQAQIDGMHRQIIEQSARMAMPLPANAPHGRASAQRVIDIVGETGE